MTNVITDIQPLEEDPNFRVVFVNNSPKITIPAIAVEKLGLETEQLWTNELSNQIKSFEDFELATNMALKLISTKAWGVKELAARLIKRGIDSHTADLTTKQLCENGWLNDFTYACARIREWTRLEPASRAWLRHKLSERKLSDETANDAINEELGERSEQDAATQLATIRLSKAIGNDEATVRRRVISALGRRGFSSDVAAEALRRAQSEKT